MKKIEVLIDSLNSKNGTVGKLINDPGAGQQSPAIANNLQTITATISDGKGSIGKLINDDTLYSGRIRPWTSWTRSPPT